MRARRFAALLGVVGLLSLTGCLDAAYVEVPANDCRVVTNQPVLQTFVAQSNGVLDQVSAVLGTQSPADDPAQAPITVEVRTTLTETLPIIEGVGADPVRITGQVLGTGTWAGPRLPDTSTFADIALDTPVPVTLGREYALVFTNTNPAVPMCVWARTLGTYPDGQTVEGYTLTPVFQFDAWLAPRPNTDIVFKTWVTPDADTGYQAVPANECRVTWAPFAGQPAWPIAQTFTANSTGSLNKVSAVLGTQSPADDPADAPITITVQTLTPQGAPSGVVLGAGTWAGPALPDTSTFADITLTTPAPVTAGTSYALVFTNSTLVPMCVWSKNPGTFSAGQMLASNLAGWSAVPGTDALFKTWVVRS